MEFEEPERRATRRDETVRPTLTVGPVDDPVEREADAVADQVVRAMASNQTISDRPVFRQRASQVGRVRRATRLGVDGGHVDRDTDRFVKSSMGGGRPLPTAARVPMEAAFGADFASVRVHDGPSASAASERIAASAFTVGQDVFFRDGLPDVSSPSGQRLLAHELTHTLQQGTGARRTIRRHLDMHDMETWGNATAVAASSDGVGGVIFLSDDDSTLVIKPGVRAAEEQISSVLHDAVGASPTEGGWSFGGLETVSVGEFERLQLRHTIDGLAEKDIVDEYVDPKLKRLRNEISDDGTTMIQEAAARGSMSPKAAMVAQTRKPKGHFKDNKKMAVRKSSPLKKLFNDPSYAHALGRALASDIFVGNYDRIAKKANFDNWLEQADSKRISLIDNVGGNAVETFEAAGSGRAEFDAWAGGKWVTSLAAGRFAEIAKVVWAFTSQADAEMNALLDERGYDTHGQTVADEMVIGFEYNEALGAQEKMVGDAERQTLRNKMSRRTKKREPSHVEKIQANFAAGLAAGRDAIIALQGRLPETLPVTYKARHMFMARWYVLRGVSANEAWVVAGNNHPPPGDGFG